MTSPTTEAPQRGSLMTAEEIATDIFGGAVSPGWVRRKVTPRVRMGRVSLWYESDVRAWVNQHGDGDMRDADLAWVPDGREESRLMNLSAHVQSLKMLANVLKGRIDWMAARAAVVPATEREVLADARLMRSVVYGLVDPRAPGMIRYVGQTKNPAVRYMGHLTGTSAALTEWFESMASEGVWPAMLLLEEVPAEALDDRESYWIHHHRDRGMADLNMAIGKDNRNP